MDNALDTKSVSGLYGYKFNGVYHMFYDKEYADYENLGKDIIIELHNMNLKEIKEIKDNIKKINNNTLKKYICDYFNGFYSTAYAPCNIYCVEISLWEPTVSEKAQYIYIMDLDSDALVVKHSWETKTIKFIDIRNLWSGRFGYVSPF